MLKEKRNESEVIEEREVIWENKRKFYINNEEVDHATWLHSIMVSPRIAYKILKTEKTGKNVLEEKNKKKMQQIKWILDESFYSKVSCLICAVEIKIGDEVYHCSTCGCLYCEDCAGEELYFRTKKAKDGTYCLNCF